MKHHEFIRNGRKHTLSHTEWIEVLKKAADKKQHRLFYMVLSERNDLDELAMEYQKELCALYSHPALSAQNRDLLLNMTLTELDTPIGTQMLALKKHKVLPWRAWMVRQTKIEWSELKTLSAKELQKHDSYGNDIVTVFVLNVETFYPDNMDKATEILSAIFQQGARPDPPDRMTQRFGEKSSISPKGSPNSPLSWATRRAHVDLVKALIKQGASLRVPGQPSPLYTLASEWGKWNHEEVDEKLKNYRWDDVLTKDISLPNKHKNTFSILKNTLQTWEVLVGAGLSPYEEHEGISAFQLLKASHPSWAARWTRHELDGRLKTCTVRQNKTRI